MTTEQEFTQWLRRPDKTFEESLLFAKNAWQSFEFSYANKYETIFNWLTSALPEQAADATFPALTFREVLSLRAQPGLVATATKLNLVHAFLALSERSSSADARGFAELLSCLLNNEVLQDLFRADHTLLAHIYGVLFDCYRKYLKEPGCVPSAALETEFLLSVLQLLKDFIKRTHDLHKFEISYRTQLLPPLVRLLQALGEHGLDFFEELVLLEQMCTESMENDELLMRMQSLDVETCHYTLGCALQNRRNEVGFLKYLLMKVFKLDLHKRAAEDQNEGDDQSSIDDLRLATHTLKMLNRNHVNLNFEYKEETALQFIAQRLLKLVAKHKDAALCEVLRLLCAALRLNPLLLEANVFQLTTWMLVAPKSTAEAHTLYAEFIVLLLDMFRRLSRAERFVTNFLKALKDWLSNYELPPLNVSKKKRELQSSMPATKRQKTDGPDFIEVEASCSFPELQAFWPNESVGVAFSKLIANLVTKPSMVVWKSILYSFKEQLALEATCDLDNNTLFLFDLHSALLCQYYRGTRLAEQSHKFADELNALRTLNREILTKFGRFVLAREHNKRLMQAFLECSFHATAFELLLSYYAPDGLRPDNALAPVLVATQIHGHLTDAEWQLIEQRVLNFGKRNCKKLFERIQLQRADALDLLKTNLITDEAAAEDNERQPYKFEIKLNETKLAALTEFGTFCEHIKQLNVQGTVSLSLHERCEPHEVVTHKQLQIMADVLNEHVNAVDLAATLPVAACVALTKRLLQLSVAYLRSVDKLNIFLRLLALYRDVSAAQTVDDANFVLSVLTDLLERGDSMPIFKYFNANQLLRLLPVRACLPFHKQIFQNYIRQQVKGTPSYLSELTEYLKAAMTMTTKHQLKFNDDVELLLLAIETLASITGPSAKLMHKYLDEFLAIYASFVRKRFKSTKKTNAAEDAEFVNRTLAGYSHYVKSCVSKAAAKAKQVQQEQAEPTPNEIDDDFRRISKIYIGHSLNYRNMNSLRLMSTALNYRPALHLDQDEIEFVLSGYWRQLNDDLKANALPLSNCTEQAIKLIINNKTNEDLLLTLRQLDETALATLTATTELSNVLALLELIAKCPFSSIKGAIFNEQFTLITTHIMLRLCRREQQQQQQQQYDASYCAQALLLLNCQRAIAENRTVPLSSDTLDGIISLLLHINIKKFTLTDASLAHFVKLHACMTALCTLLLRQRAMLLLDRVPQFLQVFNDLIQAIVWYKCERKHDAVITANELQDLEELTIKLTTLVGLMKTHSVAVKRLAPFVLTQTIHLMVTNKRPTTLYPQIKIHIESICHVLIGICDHRSGRFILRNCNDAGRQLYERLHTDYMKYQKFKGKV